ncbi:MAG: PDZ domain-containing protein [Cellulosilyticum sp.]|nr:PDZ domain-containing protein [Cellulosilyticum sp.]
MKQKKIVFGCMVLFLIGIILLFKEKELNNGYFSSSKLRFLMKYINEEYFYVADENAAKDGIYEGYLKALGNSGTYYLDHNALGEAIIEEQGNRFGIGIQFVWSPDERYLIVEHVLEDSPAARAGIQIGDCITKINEVQTLPIYYDELMALLNHSVSGPIQYEIKRNEAFFQIELEPEEIVLDDIKEEMIEDVLYIRLQSIKQGTSMHLESILQVYENQCKGVILDIRALRTDYVEEVKKISDLFLDEDIAFKVETKSNEVITYETAEGSYNMPLILLTNAGTRSGAEALALALQDRAEILGGNTGGEAYIKKIISFEDGTGMSVASGQICDRYGKTLSEEGIEPDVRVYINEVERLLLLESGKLDKLQDLYITEALSRF